MFYNVLKAKDIADLNGERFKKEVLLQSGDTSFSIVAIKKDEIIDTHTSIKDAAVYVLEGEIEIHFDAEKFSLSKGELIMFKKDTEHKVLAKKESKFMLIKAGD